MATAQDLARVQQLVVWERHWRDRGEWERMRAAYHPDSLVRLAWFTGTGPEFVEASRSIHQQGQSKHCLSLPLVRLNGARGVAETDAIIETRTLFGDIEADTAAHCRLLSRVRKDAGTWRLASLDCIYEKDTLRPVDPSVSLTLDRSVLDRFRPSYRFICYNLHLLSRRVNSDLPGYDRPELVAALYAEADAWLSAAG